MISDSGLLFWGHPVYVAISYRKCVSSKFCASDRTTLNDSMVNPKIKSPNSKTRQSSIITHSLGRLFDSNNQNKLPTVRVSVRTMHKYLYCRRTVRCQLLHYDQKKTVCMNAAQPKSRARKFRVGTILATHLLVAIATGRQRCTVVEALAMPALSWQRRHVTSCYSEPLGAVYGCPPLVVLSLQ